MAAKYENKQNRRNTVWCYLNNEHEHEHEHEHEREQDLGDKALTLKNTLIK
jgi:hypothetical protein